MKKWFNKILIKIIDLVQEELEQRDHNKLINTKNSVPMSYDTDGVKKCLSKPIGYEEDDICHVEEKLDDYLPYNEVVSKKILILISGLSKIQTKVRINIKKNSIDIKCNLNRFKTFTNNQLYIENETFIYIHENGFTFEKTNLYNTIKYLDNQMLEKAKLILLKNRSECIVRELINNIDEVMETTNIMRECNLSQILDENDDN